MVPASLPSLIMALISSSVTESSVDFLILKILKNALLTAFSNQTIGYVILANTRMGAATALASFSARNKPMRLGINSPKMIDRNVTTMTTIVVEMPLAYRRSG